MNAAEHIVQSFFWEAESPTKKQHGRRYLTISNLIGGSNREIDILAISGNGKDRIRVECEIAVNWPFTREGVEDRICYKMINDKHSRKATEEIFGTDDYRKVFVVWSNPFANERDLSDNLLAEQCEVWSIQDLLTDLLTSIGTANYQDDVLRLMSMMSTMMSSKAALRTLDCGRVSADVCKVSPMSCINAVAKLGKKLAADSGKKTVSAKHLEQALEQIEILCSKSVGI